jgi:hypothetical protein
MHNVLQRVDLDYVAKRYFNTSEAGYSITSTCIVLDDYVKLPTEKPGLVLLGLNGTIDLKDHLALVQLHPQLLEAAEVSSPVIVSPDTKEFIVGVRPFKKDIDWESLPFLAKLYVLSDKLF